MKICSLVPSATEILYALGLEDEVVAVTDECDYPPAVKSKPKITTSVIDQSESSATIDRLVSQQLDSVGSLYELDLALLERLKPDIIITQKLCSVCAVSYDHVAEAVKDLSPSVQVLNLEPNSVEDILQNILQVGEVTNRSYRAKRVVAGLRDRIRSIENKTKSLADRPTIFCMEWIDPPYCAGHWIPELVELAGGIDRLGRTGLPSFRIDWKKVVEFSPQVIAIMCCGFSVERTLEEIPRLTLYEGWDQLPAVQREQVYVIDGSAYFSRPGPRIVDSLEILASILHPDLFGKSLSPSVVVKLNTNQYIYT